MKHFECQNCRTAVYFDSTVCVHCGHRLGYIPERFEMSALAPEGDRFMPYRSLVAWYCWQAVDTVTPD